MALSLRLSAVIVIACLSTLSSAAQGRVENLLYSTDVAGAHRGDLYEPRGKGPFAALVFLHGGSWRSGSKREFERIGEGLARQGYASFAIDYDLKPRSFPLSWNEARTAVRFVREHATEYHVDPNRIVISGTSAGGELAALVALTPDGPLSQPESHDAVTQVAAAVIFNGVYDLCFNVGVIKRYLGGDCSSRRDVFADASPVDHVHGGAPPFFVGHGTRDRVVPYEAAKVFEADLRRAGVSVTSFVAQGGPHMYWTKDKYYSQNLAAVENFLAQTVGKPDLAQAPSPAPQSEPE